MILNCISNLSSIGMCRTVTSDPQKTSGCGSRSGRYLADQGDGAVVSNMKEQELAEVGTCGDQKGGEDVPGREKASNKLLVDLDGMSSINSHCVLLHLKFSHAPTGAPTKCGYYICHAARFPKVPQVLLLYLFSEAEKWLPGRVLDGFRVSYPP